MSSATAVLDTMRRRLERGPHAALGVAADADPAAVKAAFMQLTKTYHPAKFSRERPEIVRLANEVFLSLRAAYELVSSGKAKPPPATVEGQRERPTPSPSPPPPIAATPAQGVPTTMPKRDSSKFRIAATPATTPAVTTPAAPATPAGVRIATPPRRDSDRLIKAQITPTQKMGQLRQQPPPISSQPIPQLTEEAELEVAMDWLRRRQWTEAKKAFHSLAARDPNNKRYRALLSYARGREAQDEARHDIAREEFARAIQLDPELNIARVALGQVAPEEPKKPPGGLLSRLLKK